MRISINSSAYLINGSECKEYQVKYERIRTFLFFQSIIYVAIYEMDLKSRWKMQINSPFVTHTSHTWPYAGDCECHAAPATCPGVSTELRHRFATYCGSRISRSFRFDSGAGEIEASFGALQSLHATHPPHPTHIHNTLFPVCVVIPLS